MRSVSGENADGECAVQVQSLDEKPVEHGRAGVLQEDVEALAQIRLERMGAN